MGYYTCFSLSVDKNDEVIEQLREENSEAKWALDSDGATSQPGKWYNADEDMKKFSLTHPEILFTLSGDGDDSEDLWTAYYKNGKMQRCPVQFVYDEYDESKLV